MFDLEKIKEDKGLLSLAILRIILALMLLWAFFDKLLGLGLETPAGHGMIDGGSPSMALLYFDGPVATLMHGLAGNLFIDVLMMVGLLFIGGALLLGIGTKITTIAGTAFFIMMFLVCMFPADNPILDYHLIYIFGLLAIYFYHAGDCLGLGEWWRSHDIVDKYPILD